MDAKLKNLKSLSVEEATSMKQSIRAVGWEKVDVDRLSSSVDEAVRREAAASKKARRIAQNCTTWELYPTHDDWEFMSDGPTPWSLKFDRAVAVCKKIGLTLPNEKTRGRILEALLAANNVPLERDKSFFKLLERLGEALGRLRHRDAGAHIEIFPPSPLDLPEDIFARAYPDAKPSMREFPALGEMTKDLRKSSIAYKKAHEPLMLHLSPSPTPEMSAHTAQPTGSPMDAYMAISESLGQSAVDPWRAMACMMLGANTMQAQAPFHPSASSPVLQNVIGFPRPLRLEDTANAVRDETVQGEDQEPAGGCKAGGRGRAASPQSGESSMFGSGGSQWLKDDGAGCSQPDINPVDADVAMRVALAKRAFMKKTASARRMRLAAADAREACVKGTCTEKTFSFLSNDKRRTKHQFCSGWYHKTRNRLRKDGRSEAKIKQELREVYTAAGKVWDRHMKS